METAPCANIPTNKYVSYGAVYFQRFSRFVTNHYRSLCSCHRGIEVVTNPQACWAPLQVNSAPKLVSPLSSSWPMFVMACNISSFSIKNVLWLRCDEFDYWSSCSKIQKRQ
jgi:hypothetical protein